MDPLLPIPDATVLAVHNELKTRAPFDQFPIHREWPVFLDFDIPAAVVATTNVRVIPRDKRMVFLLGRTAYHVADYDMRIGIHTWADSKRTHSAMNESLEGMFFSTVDATNLRPTLNGAFIDIPEHYARVRVMLESVGRHDNETTADGLVRGDYFLTCRVPKILIVDGFSGNLTKKTEVQ